MSTKSSSGTWSSLPGTFDQHPQHRQGSWLQYATKLKSNQSNPAYEAVFTPQFRNFYTSKPSYIRPLAYRIEDQLDAVCSMPVVHHSIPDMPPWHLIIPETDFSMTTFKKDSISHHRLQLEFMDVLCKYPESVILYRKIGRCDFQVRCLFIHLS